MSSTLQLEGVTQRSPNQQQYIANNYRIVKMLFKGDYLAKDTHDNKYLLSNTSQTKRQYEQNRFNDCNIIEPIEIIQDHNHFYEVFALQKKMIWAGDFIAKNKSEIYCVSLLYNAIRNIIRPLVRTFLIKNIEKFITIDNIFIRQTSMFLFLRNKEVDKNVYKTQLTSLAVKSKLQKLEVSNKMETSIIIKFGQLFWKIFFDKGKEASTQSRSIFRNILISMKNGKISLQQLERIMEDRSAKKKFMSNTKDISEKYVTKSRYGTIDIHSNNKNTQKNKQSLQSNFEKIDVILTSIEKPYRGYFFKKNRKGKDQSVPRNNHFVSFEQNIVPPSFNKSLRYKRISLFGNSKTISTDSKSGNKFSFQHKTPLKNNRYSLNVDQTDNISFSRQNRNSIERCSFKSKNRMKSRNIKAIFNSIMSNQDMNLTNIDRFNKKSKQKAIVLLKKSIQQTQYIQKVEINDQKFKNALRERRLEHKANINQCFSKMQQIYDKEKKLDQKITKTQVYQDKRQLSKIANNDHERNQEKQILTKYLSKQEQLFVNQNKINNKNQKLEHGQQFLVQNNKLANNDNKNKVLKQQQDDKVIQNQSKFNIITFDNKKQVETFYKNDQIKKKQSQNNINHQKVQQKNKNEQIVRNSNNVKNNTDNQVEDKQLQLELCSINMKQVSNIQPKIDIIKKQNNQESNTKNSQLHLINKELESKIINKKQKDNNQQAKTNKLDQIDLKKQDLKEKGEKNKLLEQTNKIQRTDNFYDKVEQNLFNSVKQAQYNVIQRKINDQKPKSNENNEKSQQKIVKKSQIVSKPKQNQVKSQKSMKAIKHIPKQQDDQIQQINIGTKKQIQSKLSAKSNEKNTKTESIKTQKSHNSQQLSKDMHKISSIKEEANKNKSEQQIRKDQQKGFNDLAQKQKKPQKTQENKGNRMKSNQSNHSNASSNGANSVKKQVDQYIYMINRMGQAVAKTSKLNKKLQKVQWYTGLYFLYKRFFYQRKQIEKYIEQQVPKLTRKNTINQQDWKEWFQKEQAQSVLNKCRQDNKNIQNSLKKMAKKMEAKQIPGRILLCVPYNKNMKESTNIAVQHVVDEYDQIVQLGMDNDPQIFTHLCQMVNSLYVLGELDKKITEKRPVNELSNTKYTKQELSKMVQIIYDKYEEQ